MLVSCSIEIFNYPDVMVSLVYWYISIDMSCIHTPETIILKEMLWR